MSESVVSLPTPQREVRIEAALREIDAYRQLEADWDLEGALAIDSAAADTAARLVELVDLHARECGLTWQDPVVGPVADGGIALSWDSASRRALLVVHPGQLNAIECVTRTAGLEPIRRISTLADAVTDALWALDSVP